MNQFPKFMLVRAATAVVGLTAAACGTLPEGTITFFGRVYDGVEGMRLNTYDIELQSGETTEVGVVAEDGHYVLGPLAYYSDYTTRITAAGYRPFLSHNPMPRDFVSDADDPTVHDRAYYYDAFLFPEGVDPGPVEFVVTYAESAVPAAGQVRLSPTANDAAASNLENNPVGVLTQIWLNDEDLQAGTVTKDLLAGVGSFGASELVYGVLYDVRVYNLPGHADIVATYRAGFQERVAFVAQPLTDTPLTLSYKNTLAGAIVPNGDLVLIFNQPIEFDELSREQIYREAVDDGFALGAQLLDGDATFNVLPADSLDNVQERGTGINILGNTMTLSWNGSLQVSDSGDTIVEIRYGGLDQVRIRPLGEVLSASYALTDIAGISPAGEIVQIAPW